MPVQPATAHGLPGYRWGKSGRVYVYTPNNEASRKRALALAEKQGRAAFAGGYRGDAIGDPEIVASRRPMYPTGIEALYRRQLLMRLRVTNALLIEEFAKALAEVGPSLDERAARRDAPAEQDLAKLLRVVEIVQLATAAAMPPSNAALNAIASQVDLFTTKEQTKTVRSVQAIGIVPTPELAQLYRSWTAANVDLIKSIDAQYFDQIQATVFEAVKTGRTTREIAADLQERYQVTQSRAKFIARDQIAKLNGEITMHRQTKLGVKRYKWSTSHDELVRASHRAQDGEIYEWTKPPPTGHPGFDFQCRCVAIPVFDDDMAIAASKSKPAPAAPMASPSTFNPAGTGGVAQPFPPKPPAELPPPFDTDQVPVVQTTGGSPITGPGAPPPPPLEPPAPLPVVEAPPPATPATMAPTTPPLGPEEVPDALHGVAESSVSAPAPAHEAIAAPAPSRAVIGDPHPQMAEIAPASKYRIKKEGQTGTVYHYTNEEGGAGIQGTGFRATQGTFGTGVYTTVKPVASVSQATLRAYTNKVVHVQVDLKNIIEVRRATGVDQLLEDLGLPGESEDETLDRLGIEGFLIHRTGTPENPFADGPDDWLLIRGPGRAVASLIESTR